MGSNVGKLKLTTLNILSHYGNVPNYDLPYFYLTDLDSYDCKWQFNFASCTFADFVFKDYDTSFLDCAYQETCLKYKSRTKSNPNLNDARSIWHIPITERIFLPEFKINKSVLKSDFMIIDLISKGAFGKVYKVEELSTKKTYALKILQKSQVIVADGIRQLKDEIRIHKACGHHKFIVNCLFTWQSYSLILIVTEYKPGGDLFCLLEKFSLLTEGVARLYIAEIAIAIDFLHNAGVIYRDLKPENILLDEQCHICLTDFGLSKWLSRGSRTTTVCGSPHYMAPEVQNGKRYTHAVDWWSLGVLACRLLTHQYPTEENFKIQLPDAVSANIPAKDLLLRLLTHDPIKRLRSLYTLKTISFFKNYNFNDVIEKKINPVELLRQCQLREINQYMDVFTDFDS